MFLKTPLHTQTDKYNGNFIYEYPTDSVTYTTAENDEIVSLQTMSHTKPLRAKDGKVYVTHRTANNKQWKLESAKTMSHTKPLTGKEKEMYLLRNIFVETVTHKTAMSKGWKRICHTQNS